jgi:site-specific recombinase XerD
MFGVHRFAGPTLNTRRAYRRAIARFTDWASGQGIALAEIRAGDVGRYLKQLPGKTSSKKQHRAALKRFFDILVERHICLINPAAVARTEKLVVKQGLTPEIEKDEIQTLLASLQRETLAQMRDRAIIGILIYTACRAGAISKLRREDYGGRPGNRWLHLAEKGGNSQKVPVRSDLEQWIDAYLEKARIETAFKDLPLFQPLLRKEQRLQSKHLRANDV